MADVKPGETAPAAASAAPAPDAHTQAIRSAIADLEKLAAEASGRGDQATVERLRAVALPLADAANKARA